ncbi:MAG: pentapeptide repeat-containing protein [Planctomycetota bacterium]|nr:pentapeptide repeat-containing protein [Planctomycetota bacterium]
MTGAILDGANLGLATGDATTIFAGAAMKAAILDNADFSTASLDGADFTGADLTGTIF